jgi:hypothetical protein
MEKINFGWTGMAWNRGSWFMPDWNGQEKRKTGLALAQIKLENELVALG